MWFIDAKCNAQNYKVGIDKNILIFTSISDDKKIDSEKTITSTANISYNKDGMEDLKIYNAMTKLENEELPT